MKRLLYILMAAILLVGCTKELSPAEVAAADAAIQKKALAAETETKRIASLTPEQRAKEDNRTREKADAEAKSKENAASTQSGY